MTIFRKANEWLRYVKRQRGATQELATQLTRALENGEILIPNVTQQPANYAGGTNHCPNSDLSYSQMAATVSATLPGTAGDTNLEAYRFYRQAKGSNITVAASNALKATGHSLYAANEGATPALPIWNRVDGWVEMGSTGTQYDIAVQLLSKIVGPGQRWFVRFRCSALNAALLPANVQAFAGFWHKYSAGEGWVQGSAFTLSYEIHGTAGATAIEYRVLAKTDSGVSILSNVLSVPDAPAVLSANDYVKLYYNAGPGFIEFQVFKKVGSAYSKVHTVRNSTDLQFNDIGDAGSPETGWPVVTGSAPQAYAETRTLRVSALGQTWAGNDLTVDVPSTYDFSQTNTDGLFFRFGLTNPTGVDRHLGIDRLWVSTTYNEWAPDSIRLADGTTPIPSISPTSGSQGGGSGVLEPPPGGSGGGTCVLTRTPVLTVARGRNVFRRFESVRVGEEVKGEERLPYTVLSKKTGAVAEFYEIKTKNGVTVECSVDHPLALSTTPRERVEARHVEVGVKLACWVKGRKTLSEVVSKKLVPRPAEVGTFTLRHAGGLHGDGQGMYVAGRSKAGDRGLFCFNMKRDEGLFL